MSEQSSETSVAGGKLRPCPNSPNCVCSLDRGRRQFVEPLTFDEDPAAAFLRLKHMLAAWPRTQVVRDEPVYLAAKCTSLIFRFVDDIEFALDTRQKLIHVRSASRLGYSDFGVNRRRVEEIRKAFQQGRHAK